MDNTQLEQWQKSLAETIAACWVKLYDGQGIVFDTFEELVERLKTERVCGATSSEIMQSTDKLWNMLSKMFGAVENPCGVITFAKEQLTRALQRRDNLVQSNTAVVASIETILPAII